MTGEKRNQGTRFDKSGILLQFIAAYAVILSVFAAYDSVFQFDAGIAASAVMLCVVIPVPGLLLRNGTHMWEKSILLILAMGILAALFYRHLLNGIAPYVNAYIEQRNRFYRLNQMKMDVSAQSADHLLVLAGLQMLFGIILIVSLKKRRGGIAALLILLIPVLLAATVGHMPSSATSWGLLASGSLYYIVYHRRDGKLPLEDVGIAATILLLLYCISFLLQPQIIKIKDTYNEEYQNIQEYLIAMQNQNFDMRSILKNRLESKDSDVKTGIGEGDLSDLSELKTDGTEALIVTLSERPDSRIYLRAYTGATYTGERWEELQMTEFSKLMPLSGTGDERRELMREPFFRIENSSGQPKSQKMQIEIVNASVKYGYSPYYAYISDKYSVRMDSYVEGKGRQVRTYQYYPREVAESIEEHDLSEPSELWNTYQDFIKDAYLKYPESSSQLSDLCSHMDQTSADSVSDAIDQLFENGFRYTRSPGEKPSDQDLVQYFLFQSRRGFCVHFATASVLIYRECGYPARYAEGYAVSPDDFIRQEDGTYQAVVTDDMAHAWCETFDSGIGWRVREHTLSYSSGDERTVPVGDTSEGDVSVTQENPSGTKQEAGVREEAEEKKEEDSGAIGQEQNSSDDKDSSESKRSIRDSMPMRIVRLVSMVLFIVLVMTCLCMIQQRIRRQRKLYQFRVRRGNRGITAMYQEIYEICIFLGMEQKNRSDRENLKRMEAGFPQLTEETWEWLYDCAARAAFSPQNISIEERKKFYEYYRRFRTETLKQLKGRRKFWFLFVKAM